MSPRTILASLSLLVVAAAPMACGGEAPSAPGESTAQSKQEMQITPDPCTLVTADSTTTLPASFLFGWQMSQPPVVVQSNSGFYGAPYAGRTCLGWVVDFDVQAHADSFWSTALNEWIGAPIIATIGAWDLPSSGAGHTAPGNPVDASRETIAVTWYRKSAGDASFVQVPSSAFRIQGGVVKVGAPTGAVFGFQTPDPGAPDLIYRAVLTVQERTSFHEAQIVLDNPPTR